MSKKNNSVLLNGSRLIIESLVRSGADAFVGYPITPANYLYLYSTQRFPETFHAPDEITVLQWMSGMSAAGKLPVTATSFPGFALMVESINMAYMMELPMIIVLAQRLGPSTGTATCGAQGDISLINGLISGGYPLPAFCLSDFNDCWNVTNRAVNAAVGLRTPVVILTSKEMVMTSRSFDIDSLPAIQAVDRHYFNGKGEYKPYLPKSNHVPPLLPLNKADRQVRITASTHDHSGILQHSTKEALGNTKRLPLKIKDNIKDYTLYEYDRDDGAETLIVSYGISSAAAREAVKNMRKNKKVSLLIAKTLLPVPEKYYEIISQYSNIVVAEENLDGIYSQILFGKRKPDTVCNINVIGRMVSANQIIEGVK